MVVVNAKAKEWHLDKIKRKNFNLNECYVVGDTGNLDMQTDELAGIMKVLKTGKGGGLPLTTYRKNGKMLNQSI